MSQVSILAIDVSQGVDSTGVSTNGSTTTANSNNEFSQLMAKHQQPKGGNNSHAGGKATLAKPASDKQPMDKAERQTMANDQAVADSKVEENKLNGETDQHSNDALARAADKKLIQDDSSQSGKQHQAALSEEQLALLAELKNGKQAQSNEDIAAELLAFMQAVDEVSTERKAITPLTDKAAPVAIPSIVINGKVGEKEQFTVQQPATGEQQAETAGAEQAETAGAEHAGTAVAGQAGTAVAGQAGTTGAEQIGATEAEQAGNGDNNGAKQTVAIEQPANHKVANDSEAKQTAMESDTVSSEASSKRVLEAASQNPENIEQKASDQQISQRASTNEHNEQKDPQFTGDADTILKTNELNAKAVTSQDSQLTAEQISRQAASDETLINNESIADKPSVEANINVKGNGNNSAAKSSDNNQAPQVIASEQKVNTQETGAQDNEIKEMPVSANNNDMKSAERRALDVGSERVVNQANANMQSANQSPQQELSQQKQSQQLVKDNLTKEGEQEVNVKEQVFDKIASDVTDKAAQVNHATTATAKPIQSIIAGEEYAISQTAAKAQADSVAVQSSKSAIYIQNETIAIYRKDFSNALKDKVMVMVNQKIKQLDIRLDPPELGSMQVRVNMQNEQAAVNFVVQNQQAKEALEQNIHKLKEMLSESGVDVGDTNIEQRQPQSDGQEELAGQQQKFGNKEEDGVEQSMAFSGQNLYKASATGVDYYA